MPSPRLGFGRAFGLIALNAAVSFGLGFVVLAPRFAPDPENPLAPSWFAALFVAGSMGFGALALVWWGSVRAPGRTWREVGWHLDRWPVRVASGLLGGVLIVAGILGIHLWIGETVLQFLESVADVSGPQRLVLLGVGLGAGFVEETLFRGNLQPPFEGKLGHSLGIVATAGCFAIYHLNPSIPGLLGKVLVGVVCGALRGRDHSLVGSATAHATVWVLAGLA